MIDLKEQELLEKLIIDRFMVAINTKDYNTAMTLKSISQKIGLMIVDDLRKEYIFSLNNLD